MAKMFQGFTTEQQSALLKKMGHDVPAQQDEIDKFLAASPAAAASMGNYAKIASQRVAGAPLSGTVAMANGGVATNKKPPLKSVEERLRLRQKDQIKAQTRVDDLTQQLSEAQEGSEEYTNIQTSLEQSQASLDDLNKRTARLGKEFSAQQANRERKLLSGTLKDPASVLQQAEGATFGDQAAEAGSVDPSTGQTQQRAPAAASRQTNIAKAAMPEQIETATYDAATAAEEVGQELEGLEAAQGQVSEEVVAETQDPETLAQLQLQAAQADAAEVAAVNPRELQPGEAVDGSAVDMQAVDQALQIEAAQADPSKKATVQGQLEELMQDFEGGETPVWAAGAMRQANQALVARGLGASSLAGQAVIQATMEAAIPIAQADAQTFAAFESQNLSNRQQTVMFAAQQRAQFLGQKFDQDFQSKVLNAAKISEIANLNFTAEQQVALENARLANSVNIANLNAENAKVLADAAAMSQMELTNLNNRQQAQVQNAQNFLQMDLANLNNQQQTNLFKSQQMTNALLSDTAAENAALQFNAASENQTNQFMADLASTVSRFNAEQTNQTRQFNVSQTNEMARFNKTMQAERDRFNANNALVVAQANAQWRQNIATSEFQSQHEVNLANAQAYNNLTSDQLNQLWQRERDIMAFAFTGAENAADREIQLLMGDRNYALQQQQLDADEKAAYGALAATVLFGGGGGGGLLGGLF
jgi:hypothetical protein